MDDAQRTTLDAPSETDSLARFTESYASFSRIVNSLQRKYLELKDEFGAQNEQLAEANRQLVRLNERNLAATEFLNSLLDSTTAGVVAVDQSGRITCFNPAASLAFGIRQKEAIGRHYGEVLPVGEPGSAGALRTAETGQEVTSVERIIPLNTGGKLVLSVSTAVLRSVSGAASGAVEVFQDLTKTKRLEHELARLNTLAALGEMAATVAHEVRNPLNGIAGFAALLERDLDESDPRRETVRKIIRGVETLNHTVSTLLDYARFKEINRSATPFREFLRATVDKFVGDNRDRVRGVEIEMPPIGAAGQAPVTLMLDPVLMRQVFINVLDNAVEAMRGRGRIRLASRCLPRREAATRHSEKVLLDADETLVETTITDNGPGIPRENLERVFAPFFSTRPGGNGLGLAVAWKIVKAHGGEMQAECGSDGGAVFRILLPVKQDMVNAELSS